MDSSAQPSNTILEVQGPQASTQPKYECVTCGKKFPSSTRYHKHIKLHLGLRPFLCSVPGCPKTFTRKTHLTRHLVQHQAAKPYRCSRPGCKKGFATKQKLLKHEQSHEGLACNLCGARFRTSAKLQQHQRAHEVASGSSSSLRCPECNVEVADKIALQRHMKRHRRHQCTQCDEGFLRFQDLVKHRRTQHPKPYLCSDCGKAYTRESALRDHQRRVHAGELCICPHSGCGQTFTSASNLRVHQRVVHLGRRPFACAECDLTFGHRNVLKRHCMLIHSAQNSACKIAAPEDRREEAAPQALEDASREDVGRSTKFIRWGCAAGSCRDDCSGVHANSVISPHPPPPPSALAIAPARLSRKRANRRESAKRPSSEACDFQAGADHESIGSCDILKAPHSLPALYCY